LSELRSEPFRLWVTASENLDLFIEVLIATATGSPRSVAAEETLAQRYALVTGESKKLAPGRISTVIDYVYGQLTATESAKQKLLVALAFLGTPRLRNAVDARAPDDPELLATRAMAQALIEAGKQSWETPKFVAPLLLVAHEVGNGKTPQPAEGAELMRTLERKQNLIVFGPGGIGKTTFLLDLCSAGLDAGGPVPLFVDSAIRADSSLGLFEYLAKSLPARLHNVSAAELAREAQRGHLVLVLNVWNGIPASAKLSCRDQLVHLAVKCSQHFQWLSQHERSKMLKDGRMRSWWRSWV
jgi:hypothetical protein